MVVISHFLKRLAPVRMYGVAISRIGVTDVPSALAGLCRGVASLVGRGR